MDWRHVRDTLLVTLTLSGYGLIVYAIVSYLQWTLAIYNKHTPTREVSHVKPDQHSDWIKCKYPVILENGIPTADIVERCKGER